MPVNSASLGVAASDLWPRLTLESLERLLPELTPRVKGSYLNISCPQCGQRTAWAYPPKDERCPRVHCNRGNHCAFDKTLWQYLKERDGEANAYRSLAVSVGADPDCPSGPPPVRDRIRRLLSLPKVSISSPRAALEAELAGYTPAALYERSRRCFEKLPDDAPAVLYLAARGLSRAAAWNCGIGFVPHWPEGGQARPRLTFAHTDASGAVVAVGGRMIEDAGEGAAKVRFHGPKGNGAYFPSGRFDEDRLDRCPLAVCEGPFDAMALEARGYYAVAVSGTSVPAWLLAALPFRSVIAAHDADKAGDDASARLVSVLRPCGGKVERLRPPTGYKDWGDVLQSGRNALATALPDAPISAPRATESPVAAPRRPETRPNLSASYTEGRTVCRKVADEAQAGLNNCVAPHPGCAYALGLDALRVVFQSVQCGASVQCLTAAVRDFVSVCDLPGGYDDPADPFAADALDALRLHLESYARMTPGIDALLSPKARVPDRRAS